MKPVSWIAIGIIATWALGLVALLFELGQESRALSARAAHKTARYDGS